jgi:magnesium-transporting ATPase (P-type)
MNDVNAIGQADVGFAMGTGKTMARDAASMIMATDEFFSLARAIMWGRNIYTNVRRFVQFQFTCNISTLVTVFMGYCFLMESPLNAIQLLWINLLMDTLAALALATTPPFTNIMSEGPVQSSNATLVPVIWRQVYAISLWNIIVMAIVIFAGKGMYGIEYDRHNGVLSSVEDDQCVIAFNSEDEVLQQECCN